MVLLEIGLGSFGRSGHILAGSTSLKPCLRTSDPRLHPTTAVSLFTRVPQHCSVMVPNSFAISFYKVKGAPYPVVTLPEPAYPHPLHSIILLSHHFLTQSVMDQMVWIQKNGQAVGTSRRTCQTMRTLLSWSPRSCTSLHCGSFDPRIHYIVRWHASKAVIIRPLGVFPTMGSRWGCRPFCWSIIFTKFLDLFLMRFLYTRVSVCSWSDLISFIGATFLLSWVSIYLCATSGWC